MRPLAARPKSRWDHAPAGCRRATAPNSRAAALAMPVQLSGDHQRPENQFHAPSTGLGEPFRLLRQQSWRAVTTDGHLGRRNLLTARHQATPARSMRPGHRRFDSEPEQGTGRWRRLSMSLLVYRLANMSRRITPITYRLCSLHSRPHSRVDSPEFGTPLPREQGQRQRSCLQQSWPACRQDHACSDPRRRLASTPRPRR